MKKVFKYSFLFVVILLCTACNGSITRDIRHAGFSISNKFVCDWFFPQDKEDTSYRRIRYLTENHLIDKDGIVPLAQIISAFLCIPIVTNESQLLAIYQSKVLGLVKTLQETWWVLALKIES